MNDPPLEAISLPAVRPDEGSALLQALARRCTVREFAERSLSLPLTAQLLWAASGVNRRTGPFDCPRRTAASASNSQEIDVYVARADGAYRYDALNERLDPVAREDLRARALTPGQPCRGTLAPLTLIYVVDLRRLTHTAGFDEPGLHDPLVQQAYYYVDTGLIAGNVYLFAAAHRLATWFHNCDRDALAQHLALSSQQRVLFAQSVGYAEEAPVRGSR